MDFHVPPGRCCLPDPAFPRRFQLLSRSARVALRFRPLRPWHVVRGARPLWTVRRDLMGSMTRHVILCQQLFITCEDISSGATEEGIPGVGSGAA